MDTRRTIHPHPSKNAQEWLKALIWPLHSHNPSICAFARMIPVKNTNQTDLMGQRCSGTNILSGIISFTLRNTPGVCVWCYISDCSSVFCTISSHTFGINKVFYFENKSHCHSCLCSSALHILTQLLSKMESGEPLLGCFRSTLWSIWWRIPRGLLPQLIIVCL